MIGGTDFVIVSVTPPGSAGWTEPARPQEDAAGEGTGAPLLALDALRGSSTLR
jgi:hypothetical protein